MHSSRALVLLSILGLVACGSSEPRPAVTQTTSATIEARAQAAQAQTERDDARAQLKNQHEMFLKQANVRTAMDVQAKKNRDDLATKAWNALDNADDELLPLKEKAARAALGERERVEAVVDEALKKKGHVKANLKALSCDEVADWAAFQAQTEQAITALDEAVKVARAQVGTVAVEETETKSKAKAKR